MKTCINWGNLPFCTPSRCLLPPWRILWLWHSACLPMHQCNYEDAYLYRYMQWRTIPSLPYDSLVISDWYFLLALLQHLACMIPLPSKHIIVAFYSLVVWILFSFFLCDHWGTLIGNRKRFECKWSISRDICSPKQKCCGTCQCIVYIIL